MAFSVYGDMGVAYDHDTVTVLSMNASWAEQDVNLTGSEGNTTEVDVESLLVMKLGPRHRSMPETIILTIVYSVIFITGVVGNVCTCIVIAKNSYMQTATNYYLVSLACSDVLTLILGLPPELYTIWETYPWVFGEPFCVIKIMLSEMTSSASVLTITAFTVERYLAICHPIRAHTMSSLSRAIKINVLLWVLACATALPYALHARTYYHVEHPVTLLPIPDSLTCNIAPQHVDTMKYVFQMTAFLLFMIPMTVIIALYILIGLTLRRSAHIGRRSLTSTRGDSSPTASRRAVLKMLVAVVVAFFICWAPFHAQRLMTAFIPDTAWTQTLIETQTVLFYISGVLYFVSATVNPILYNLMSKKYRQAFKETLCRCCMSHEDSRRIRDDRGRIFSERLSNSTLSAYANHKNERRRSSDAKNSASGGTSPQRPNFHHSPYPSLRNSQAIKCDTAKERHILDCINGSAPHSSGKRKGCGLFPKQAECLELSGCDKLPVPLHNIITENNTMTTDLGTFL